MSELRGRWDADQVRFALETAPVEYAMGIVGPIIAERDRLRAAVDAALTLHKQPAVIISPTELPVIYERTRQLLREVVSDG